MAGLDKALRALLVTLLVCVTIVPFTLSTLSSSANVAPHHVLEPEYSFSAMPRSLSDSETKLIKRFVNATELDACKALAKVTKKSSNSNVYYPLAPQYTSGSSHWFSSSKQISACVYRPTTPADLAAGIKLVGDQRIRFAISSGGHASNQGFSSTKGIHITLRGFTDVKISSDRGSIDVGGGSKWDEVYKTLEGSGLNVVGGRVPGVGIGGFITGGGGYSWKTNQYGLTGDTLIEANMVLPDGSLVTASESENSDLFWAIRGGGNQFGAIYNYKLKAFPQSAKIYGGTRLYTAEQVPALLEATYDFSENNKDPKAQIITTLNSIGLLGNGAILLAIYDGEPGSTNPFAAFDKVPYQQLLGNFKEQSFSDAVASIPSQLQGGHRGYFHSVMFKRYSKNIIDQIHNSTKYWGSKQLLHSGRLVSYDIEPFDSNFVQYAKDSAWPHRELALPLNLFFSYDNPADDKFWLDAIKESARILSDLAREEGQDQSMPLYPNYLVKDTPVERIFGPNLDRLRSLKNRYDPSGIMRLTGYFDF